MPRDPEPCRPPEAPPLLMGDHPALHLLNSRARPGGREVEWIGDGVGFARWLEACGLPAPEGSDRDSAAAMDATAAAARRFREWFRGFVAAHAGRPLDAAALGALGPLNDLLSEDSLHRTVEVSADGPAWGLIRRRGGPRALLQPLAAAVGDLVCEADFSRVRRCEGPGCTIWFLDRTKGGRRRWCSMAVCGNRSKASAHRARARGIRADEAS